MLTHLCHTSLDTTTAYAAARLCKRHHFRDKRQWQRTGVRVLLQKLLDTLGISDTLDESQFPYRLTHSRYYVCFTHSNDNVGVIISCQRSVGIDIEVQDIKWQVAERFYHTDEIAILSTLTLEQRDIIARWLWQIKESFIKVNQHTLAQGMGVNYVTIMPVLLSMMTDGINLPLMVNNKNSSYPQQDYQIMIIPDQQLVIVF